MVAHHALDPAQVVSNASVPRLSGTHYIFTLVGSIAFFQKLRSISYQAIKRALSDPLDWVSWFCYYRIQRCLFCRSLFCILVHLKNGRTVGHIFSQHRLGLARAKKPAIVSQTNRLVLWFAVRTEEALVRLAPIIQTTDILVVDPFKKLTQLWILLLSFIFSAFQHVLGSKSAALRETPKGQI